MIEDFRNLLVVDVRFYEESRFVLGLYFCLGLYCDLGGEHYMIGVLADSWGIHGGSPVAGGHDVVSL